MSDMSDNKIVKKEEVKLVKQETIGFSIQSNNINEAAVQKVSQYLPELIEKTKSFGSSNSQTTLAMMSLTMLGGHSPYRMLRQILISFFVCFSFLSMLSHFSTDIWF